MNTPQHEILHVRLDAVRTLVQIRPVDQAHVKRLAESIRTHGQEVPVVLHRTDEEGVYDLGPGRHRLEALKLLGHEGIAAIIKGPASEAELRAEQVRENLDRENLSPLQEADLCANVLEDVAGDEQAAAAIMGRPVRWVQNRAALTRLHPKVREHVVDGSLPLSHAQLIARIASQQTQLDIARRVRAGAAGERPARLSECLQLVESEGSTLHDVNWRLDVAFGTKQPTTACNGCPHNSANRGDLFAAGEEPKKPTCLLRDCYQERAHLSSLGARKAANWISKEGLKPTPANAEKAVAAREVPFVDPSAVKGYYQGPAPKKSAKKGASEAKTQKPDEALVAQARAEQKFRDAKWTWERKCDELMEKALKGKPLALALLAILGETVARQESWSPSNKATKAMQQTIKPLLAKVNDVTADTLLAAARLVDAREVTLDLGMFGDECFAELAKALKVELPAKPTLDQFKPKAEAKPAAKKPTTKKPAKSGKGK